MSQMLAVSYQLRDESLLNARKTSTVAVSINCLSLVTGTVVGTWVAVPPTQEKHEISSIVPILVGVGLGELIGFVLALIVIWMSREQ